MDLKGYCIKNSCGLERTPLKLSNELNRSKTNISMPERTGHKKNIDGLEGTGLKYILMNLGVVA